MACILCCGLLERLCAARASKSALGSLNALFHDAVGLGDPVELRGECDDRRARMIIESAGRRVARINLEWADKEPVPGLFGQAAENTGCRVLGPDDIEERSGALALAEPTALAATFPELAKAFDTHQVAMLLACTRLVGMECPGLLSIFTGLNLRWNGEQAGHDEMSYAVTYWSSDLRLLKMDVAAGAGSGSLEAILHPPDVEQACIATVRDHVREGEFAGRHALVIGGSRGLGEVVAKIVALGGGRATITFRDARRDAERIRDELAQVGAACDLVQFDVLSDAPIIHDGEPTITDIFYFATPQIRPDAMMGDAAAQMYGAYYSDGMKRVFRTFGPRLSPGAALFYPSTIYVEQADPKFAAYADAKRQGELAADAFAQAHGLRLFVHRLERLRTGQTASLAADGSVDPLTRLPSLIRQMGHEQEICDP